MTVSGRNKRAGELSMKSLMRPKSITIFAVIVFLAPFLTIVSNAYINMLPLWGAGSILSRLALTDIILLCVYPVAAVSIFSVTRAGWWIFIVSAAGIFVYNIIAYVRNPMVSLLGVLVFNILLFAAAGFFFRKHIIAPYFNPRLRWWEQASRYDINIEVSIGSSDSYELGYLEDISLGGCFIRISENVNTGVVYPLRISLGNDLSVSVKGKIMRSVTDDCSLPGYGVMFTSLTETEKAGLRNMISGLGRMGANEQPSSPGSEEQRAFDRYSVNISVSFRYKGDVLPAKLVNFSSTGACIETMLSMENGESCGFYCTLGANTADVDGIIKWIRKLDHHYHYGLAFVNQSKKQKTDINQMLGTIKALGGKIRSRDKKQYDQLIEKTLPGTPYRIFQKTRK